MKVGLKFKQWKCVFRLIITLADRKGVMHFKGNPFYERRFVSFCNAYDVKALHVSWTKETCLGDRRTKLKLNQCCMIYVEVISTGLQH
jgi:hypothetical protein